MWEQRLVLTFPVMGGPALGFGTTTAPRPPSHVRKVECSAPGNKHFQVDVFFSFRGSCYFPGLKP